MPQILNVDGVPGLPAVSHGLKLPSTAQLVYCSGQIHSENGPGGMAVINGSTADKTKMIVGNLEKLLKAGGSSLNQLVKVSVFDLRNTPHDLTNLLMPRLSLTIRLLDNTPEFSNTYIASFDFFGEMDETYHELVPNPKPPRTCVCVKDLPFGAQIESECIGWTES